MVALAPTAGIRIATLLRELRAKHPQCSADEFWMTHAAELIEHELKCIAPAEHPRFSKKEIQTELFNALAVACGRNPLEMTKPEQRVCAIALAEIRAASHGVEPDEIKCRVRVYKNIHRDWPVTPKAIALHWSSLGSGDRTLSAKRDIYIEPPNWREAAKKLYPAALEWISPTDFDTVPWAEIRVILGPDILRAMT